MHKTIYSATFDPLNQNSMKRKKMADKDMLLVKEAVKTGAEYILSKKNLSPDLMNHIIDQSYDKFIKRGPEKTNGLFVGCRSKVDHIERGAEIAAFAGKIISDLNPPKTTLRDIGESIGDLVGEIAKNGKEFVSEHPIATAAAAGVATGGVAYAYAGSIAATVGSTGVLGTASTGTAISSLKGAALTNAALAKFGGGALSIGGTGMAGGTAAVTTTGVAAGSSVTASVIPKDEE